MNLTELLAVLQEVNKLLTTLEGMGLKVSGTVDVVQMLAAFGAKL